MMRIRTQPDGTIAVRCQWCKHWFRDGTHDYDACRESGGEVAGGQFDDGKVIVLALKFASEWTTNDVLRPEYRRLAEELNTAFFGDGELTA